MKNKKPVVDTEPAAEQAMEVGKPKAIEDHEVEGAMQDMMRAEKHKDNPEMMKRVHALAGRHVKALKSIRSVQDLKDTYDDKYGYGKKD